MKRPIPSRLAVAVLAILLLAAACGDDGAQAESGSPAGSGSAPAEGITIRHARGTVELDGPAERIVTLGVQWTDAVLALGEQPVGVDHDANAGDDGRFPWQDGLDTDVVAVEVTSGLPMEQIAALQPDLLLVASWLVPDDATYRTLNEIAPTVAGLAEGDAVDRWQDMVTVVGQALGDEAGADEVIAGVEAELAAVGEELPGLAGKSFAMANIVAGDGIYVVADPNDGSSQLFQGFGMEIAPSVLAAAEGANTARPKFSFEQVSLLDADLLAVFAMDSDPADLPGWDNLPAVRSGAMVRLDYEPVVGLNTPSPLGLPYALELLRPALEAAAAG